MPDSANPKKPLRVFISYSHQDAKWANELRKHLSVLVRQEAVDSWDDNRIAVGSDWKDEIGAAMDGASCGVLLVSPDFLASPFIQKEELPKLLNKPHVVWVAVRASNFRHTKLGDLQCANDPAKPLAAMTRSRRDEEWVNICDKLMAVAATAEPESVVGAPRSDDQVVIWYLNGAVPIDASPLSQTPALGWKVVGEGAFGGSGNLDLVLQNATSDVIAVWYLNGTTVTKGAYVSSTPPAGWNVVGVGDFNGEDNPDLVLQNSSTNQVEIWYLNGVTVIGSAYLSTTPETGWKVVGPK